MKKHLKSGISIAQTDGKPSGSSKLSYIIVKAASFPVKGKTLPRQKKLAAFSPYIQFLLLWQDRQGIILVDPLFLHIHYAVFVRRESGVTSILPEAKSCRRADSLRRGCK